MFRNILLILKGLAMGAADIVPGVSGGTIAFITGIYEQLLSSINAINFKLLNTFKEKGIRGVWEKINGSFLFFLLMGIGLPSTKHLNCRLFPIKLHCHYSPSVSASSFLLFLLIVHEYQ